MTVSYVLCCIIVVLQVMHYFERKDLYNRIMSRDLNEYKNSDKPVKAHISAHRRVLDKWKDRGEVK